MNSKDALRSSARIRCVPGLLAALPLLAAGCAGGASNDGGTYSDVPPKEDAEETDGTGGRRIAAASGEFAQDGDGPAFSYDPRSVPDGARADLKITASEDGSTYTLMVKGFQADHAFGAQMHTELCGDDAADAGPRYQDDQDPDGPSTSEEFSNDANEVWLDFTTDGDGAAKAVSTASWRPRSGGMRSLVIDAAPTRAGGQDAEPVACLDVEEVS